MKKVFFLIAISISQLHAQELTLIKPIGHTRRVNLAVFSPDGRRVASSSDDMTAKIWDAQTGSLLANLVGHNSSVTYLAYSPDGKKLATISDSTTKVWDAETGELLFNLVSSIEEISFVSSFISFNNDGRKIATAFYSDTAKIWDATTGALLARLSGHKHIVRSAVFSPKGDKIITGSFDSTAKIWDGQTGVLLSTLKGHKNKVYYAAFSGDNQKAVTASWDKTAKIWDASNGNLLVDLIGHRDKIWFATFSPDGKKIVTTSSDKSAKVWDARTGSLLFSLDDFNGIVFSASFNKEGDKLITASSDSVLRLWDLTTGKLVFSTRGHSGPIFSAKFSTDGRKMLSASNDNTVKIWDAKSGRLENDLKGRDFFSVYATFDKKVENIILASDDSKVKIWNLKTASILENINNPSEDIVSQVISSNISPDQKKIVGPIGEVAYVCDILTKKPLVTLNGHTAYINTAYFSSTGKKIVTASLDGTAKIWDANTGKLLLNLKGHAINVVSAIFNYDDTKIVTASSDATAKIWDAQTGKLLLTINGHDKGLFMARFSNDGNRVLTASNDKTAKIWDSQTGRLLINFTGHTSGVISAEFNKGDSLISTSSWDHSIKIWDAKNGKLKYTFLPLDTINYFLQLPDLYFKCTQEAAKLLHYVTKGLKVITFDQLDLKYNRPDKVLEAIGSTDTGLISSYRMAYYKRIEKLHIDTTSFSDNFNVPEADFLDRDKIDYEQTNEQLRLRVKGNDKDTLLDRFNIYVNGSPIYGAIGINIRKRKKPDFDTTIMIALSEGKNTLTTSLFNVNGIESYRMPLVVNYTPIQHTNGKVYFIGIGANHFADASHNLNYSSKDIRDLAQDLKIKYSTELVIDTFIDEKVDKKAVISLKQKLLHTGVNDKVIIAYSGHGLVSRSQDYYLSTYKVNFKKPEEDGLLYDDLENLLDSIPARRKLMLIDACNSGELDKSAASAKDGNSYSTNTSGQKGGSVANLTSSIESTKAFDLMQELFVNVNRNTGAVVIAASKGDQSALEKSEYENGVFTHAILEYMEQHEHANVNDLKQYVNKRVIELTDGKQVPTAREENHEFDWQIW